MAETKPLLFSVEVDTKTGEVNLKRFSGQVAAEAKNIENAAGRATSGVAGFASSIKGFYGALTAVIAAVGVGAAVYKAVDFMRDAAAASAEAQTAETQLVAALKARGVATQANLDLLKRQADLLQRTTTLEDDTALKAMGLGIRFGLTVEQAAQAAEAAQEAAAATGRSFDALYRAIARSAAGLGGARILQQIGIDLRGVETGAGRAEAVIAKVLKVMGGSAAAELATYTGSLARMRNEWGNLKEAIGDFITRSPSILASFKAISDLLSETTKAFSSNTDVARPFVLVLVDMAIAATELVVKLEGVAAGLGSIAPFVEYLASFTPGGQLLQGAKDAVSGLEALVAKLSQDPTKGTTFAEEALKRLHALREEILKSDGQLKRADLTGGAKGEPIAPFVKPEEALKPLTFSEATSQGPQLEDMFPTAAKIMGVQIAMQQLDQEFELLVANAKAGGIGARQLAAGIDALDTSARSLVELGAEPPAWMVTLESRAPRLLPEIEALGNLGDAVDDLTSSQSQLTFLRDQGTISNSAYLDSLAALADGYQKAIAQGARLQSQDEKNAQAAIRVTQAKRIQAGIVKLAANAFAQEAASAWSAYVAGDAAALSGKKIIRAIADQAGVKAIFEVAEGFAALARYDIPAATFAFKSAAAYAAVAGAALAISGRGEGTAGGAGAAGGYGAGVGAGGGGGSYPLGTPFEAVKRESLRGTEYNPAYMASPGYANPYLEPGSASAGAPPDGARYREPSINVYAMDAKSFRDWALQPGNRATLREMTGT